MSLWTKVRDVVRSAAPLIGAAYGPAGAMIGGLIAPQPKLETMPSGLMLPAPSPGPGMVETAGTVRPALQAAAAAGRWLISKTGVVTTFGGKILGVMRGTRLFRNRQVVQLVKQIGIQGAATALGITAVEVAQMVAEHQMQGNRKRRGISYRDVATTRRTIGKIRSIQRGLSESGICRTPVRRKKC